MLVRSSLVVFVVILGYLYVTGLHDFTQLKAITQHRRLKYDDQYGNRNQKETLNDS